MPDAYDLWRTASADGKSVAKTLRTIWPDLAKALDSGAGLVSGGENAHMARAKRPDCAIAGPHCAGKAAGRAAKSGRLTCIPCWGGRFEFIRNPEWSLQRNPRPRREWS